MKLHLANGSVCYANYMNTQTFMSKYQNKRDIQRCIIIEKLQPVSFANEQLDIIINRVRVDNISLAIEISTLSFAMYELYIVRVGVENSNLVLKIWYFHTN